MPRICPPEFGRSARSARYRPQGRGDCHRSRRHGAADLQLGAPASDRHRPMPGVTSSDHVELVSAATYGAGVEPTLMPDTVPILYGDRISGA
jgi:hypothetical protein